jgi:hypothetical protein
MNWVLHELLLNNNTLRSHGSLAVQVFCRSSLHCYRLAELYELPDAGTNLQEQYSVHCSTTSQQSGTPYLLVQYRAAHYSVLARASWTNYLQRIALLGCQLPSGYGRRSMRIFPRTRFWPREKRECGQIPCVGCSDALHIHRGPLVFIYANAPGLYAANYARQPI